jgi:antitoxin (DNA-binding transcriptional repressor) of toxin-antitoxin stability system
MALVGIRLFKAEISRYLREVRRGKRVYLTDRGHVVAEVSAPMEPSGGGRGRRSRAADLRLRALIDRGVLRPAARADRPWARGRLVRLQPGSARRLLDADRAD